MCGIVGYFGLKQPEYMLINKLKLLEYRGYDSSGIAVRCGSEIIVTKALGEIKNLKNTVVPVEGARFGIAHTRWATHGKPAYENAHPHLSNDKKWAVVHNGIIENYQTIKSELEKKGYVFNSQTDTEVIAGLLQQYADSGYCAVGALKKIRRRLEGSYALAIINAFEDKIYFAKDKSPLFCAEAGGEFMLSSDPVCFSDFAKAYYEIDDGEYGYFSVDEGVVFFGKDGGIKNKKPVKTDCVSHSVKTHYKHFMIKEIYESKAAVKAIADYYSRKNAFERLEKINFSKYNDIRLVGCGTAYNAALMGEFFFDKLLGLECKTCVASEFRYKNPKIGKKSIVIFISQSGETADTIAALYSAKKKGALTIGIVNVEYSTIAKGADILLPLKAGAEIAVASTKAYIAQIAVLYLLAKKIKSMREGVRFGLSDVYELYRSMEKDDEKPYKKIAEILNKNENLFMIGRGGDYVTAKEACLKIKETSYVNANAYFAGELKHGFLALVDKNTYCAVFISDKKLLAKTISNAEEVKARGGKLILTTPLDVDDSLFEIFDYIIKVKKISSYLQSALCILSWQKIAYFMSDMRGFNPDKPRNLAKSVTVE